ncbi:MAG: DUF6712 family protein [Bacteroidota bacterium]
MLFRDVANFDNPNLEKDQLKYHVPAFNSNMAWETLRPLVENVEEEFIMKAIGSAQYDELQTLYDDYPNTPLNAQVENLIRKLQRSIAYFTLWRAQRETAMSISDMGPSEVVATENTVLAPRQWVFKMADKEAFREGHKHLELALAYMEERFSDFPIWAGSEAYTQSKDLFFNTSSELAEYLPAYNHRVVYLQLRASIRQAELRYIKPVLCELYDEIKQAILNSATTALTLAQLDLVNQVRLCLSNWAIKHALPLLRLEVTQEGLVAVAYDSAIQKASPASEGAVRSMWINLDQAGSEFLEQLKSFLIQRKDDFPTWRDGTCGQKILEALESAAEAADDECYKGGPVIGLW